MNGEENGWRSYAPNGTQCTHKLLEPGQPHYCDYISLGAVTGFLLPYASDPKAEPRREKIFHHPDEVQFVGVHQMFEIGFQIHIFSLRELRDALDRNDFEYAAYVLNRILGLMKVFIPLMDQLQTMSMESFMAFRETLRPASGAESETFRVIELLSGLTPESPYGKPFSNMPVHTLRSALDRPLGTESGKMPSQWWTKNLDSVSKERSVRAAFYEALARNGLKPDTCLRQDGKLREIGTSLLQYDRDFVDLRLSHIRTVARTMGSSPGLGNTEGVNYLRSVAENTRFYPELTS